MKKLLRPAVALLLLASWCVHFGGDAAAQTSTGALDLTARITPTGARPEPVRQFTFYILTRSYADVSEEVAGQDVLPSKEQFIQKLHVSQELKDWMIQHDMMDLASPEFDHEVSAADILKVPEFLVAYQRTNSGGVTKGLPVPKYRPSDADTNPEKYAKLKAEYLAELKKFIEAHPSTIQGTELELANSNPKTAWDRLNAAHRRRLAQLAPDVAQTKFLAAKVDTDLEGHAHLNGLPPGTYWVSTLGMDAAAGDRRLRWDVAFTVQPGQVTRVDLTNVNGVDAYATAQ